MVLLLDGEWLLAVDPANVGRDEHWWDGPVPAARATRVPWIIQDAFPGYHGVAWYWRDFRAPANPHAGGRYLLRFWAVDYLADVWLNGVHLGGHEGGETPFVLDATAAIRPDAENRLAVRVLNPTDEPIDGIVLAETPHRNKVVSYYAGASFDQGGIVDSVELVVAPPVRVADLFARPDPATGVVRVAATLCNAGVSVERAKVEFTVAPAMSGETLARAAVERDVAPGESAVEMEVMLDKPRLWDLSDPFLYRVTARVEVAGAVDECSTRCGFRDFRFADGAFRLNGRRVWLRCSHTGNHTPIGLQVAHDPDLLRRDLLNVKVMGFNAIRFIAGVATRYQLDLCDEIGLLVYEESYAGWLLGDSPRMAERFDRSTAEMIRRDRNHPSIVIWGLLNETKADDPVFAHAVQSLALVRSLDETRMVLLGSGRWDCRPDIGSLANPGSTEWQHLLGAEAPGAPPTKMSWGVYPEGMGDVHVYPRVPHTAETLRLLRTIGEGAKPIIITEYGIGSAVDLWRVVRHYERLGKMDVEDARFYRERLDRFLADWERWKLGDLFADPADYFRACVRKMAAERLRGLNAIRANPNVAGHSMTGTVDQGMTGEGLFTTFRELKPGTTDAVFEAFAPLRLCLFAEPVHAWRGRPVRLEAVLADEDTLPPGEYPVHLQVIGPDGRRVFERTVAATAPPFGPGRPLAWSIFADDVPIEGPSGACRFLATFEGGAAPAGGETVFHVTDPADMPAMPAEVVLWGEDDELVAWLAARGCRARPFDPAATGREVVLVAPKAQAGAGAEEFRMLARHIEAGATAVCPSLDVFRRGDDALGWLPIDGSRIDAVSSWLYLKDDWAKRHPIFDGLPCGIMDYDYYREIISERVLSFAQPPAEAVAGAIKASQDYTSGLMVSVHRIGAGRLVLSTLFVRESLATHPAAERLLRNMLRYAQGSGDKYPSA